MDWNAHREGTLAAIGELARLSPATVEGYRTLRGATAAAEPGGAGRLDARTRELIALAVAVTTRRDGCVAAHAAAAAEGGPSG